MLSKSLLSLFFFVTLSLACSKPLDPLAERGVNAQTDLNALLANSFELSEPLTLENAIRLALKRNLDLLLAEQEHAIQQEMTDARKLEMLPSLTFSGELSRRDNTPASSSRSVITGRQSLETSQSSERTVKRWDVTAMWNLLDFGLTYLRAQQAEDRERIMEERRRRVAQNLVLDVTRAYWRAMIATKAAEGASSVIGQTNDHLERLRRRIGEKTIPLIGGLESEKDLIQMKLRLNSFERERQNALTELSALIGMLPNSHYRLALLEKPDTVAVSQYDLKALEGEALRLRSELFQQDAQERITVKDAHAAILGMFPNLSPFAGYDYDGNKYLYNNYWFIAGVKTSWDIFSIPARYQEMRTADAQQQLVRKRRMALAVGILTQVHLAYINYRDALENFQLAEDLSRVNAAILAAGRKSKNIGELGGNVLVKLEIDAFLAWIMAETAYGDMIVAHVRLQNAVGRDVEPSFLEGLQKTAVRETETPAPKPRNDDAANPPRAAMDGEPPQITPKRDEEPPARMDGHSEAESNFWEIDGLDPVTPPGDTAAQIFGWMV